MSAWSDETVTGIKFDLPDDCVRLSLQTDRKRMVVLMAS